MMSDEDAVLFSSLMERSEALNNIFMSGNDYAFDDQHDAYRMWLAALEENDALDMAVLVLVTVLSVFKIFDPITEGCEVKSEAMQQMASLAFGYDNGPYRVPTMVVPYTSQDAINTLSALEMVRRGALVEARQHLFALKHGEVAGSFGQTVFVIHNMTMRYVFTEQSVPKNIVQIRASSLRMMMIDLRETVRRTGWCDSCATLAHQMLARIDDRRPGMKDEPKATNDSTWIERMNKEWDT